MTTSARPGGYRRRGRRAEPAAFHLVRGNDDVLFMLWIVGRERRRDMQNVVTVHSVSDNAFSTCLPLSFAGNNTAIADINDVDIVALYDPWRTPALRADWDRLFAQIANILHNSPRVAGTVTLGDKCVKLAGTLHADIGPAISPRPYSSTDQSASVPWSAESSAIPPLPALHCQLPRYRCARCRTSRACLTGVSTPQSKRSATTAT
jgi:hypothetical protein